MASCYVVITCTLPYMLDFVVILLDRMLPYGNTQYAPLDHVDEDLRPLPGVMPSTPPEGVGILAAETHRVSALQQRYTLPLDRLHDEWYERMGSSVGWAERINIFQDHHQRYVRRDLAGRERANYTIRSLFYMTAQINSVCFGMAAAAMCVEHGFTLTNDP
jgi:hypothetical protein